MKRPDPDFDPVPFKGEPGAGRERERDRRWVVLLAAVLAAAWFGLLVDPAHGALKWLAALAALAAVTVLAVVGSALGLAWLGFGLFALGDRVVGWVRRAGRWPEA